MSREGALVLNNLFLAAACATVFIGTLYPLALEALTGEKISVGAPFFNLTFVPLVVPLLLLVPLGQTLAWKRGDLLGAAQRLALALAISIAVTSILLGTTRGGPDCGAAWHRARRVSAAGGDQRDRDPLVAEGAEPCRRVRAGRAACRARPGAPPSRMRASGLTVIGIAATAWSVETLATVRPGERLEAGPYAVRLDGVAPRTGPNYREDVARLTVFHDGAQVGPLEATKRLYVTRGTPTTEAGIMTVGLSQVYASLGEVAERRRRWPAPLLQAAHPADLAWRGRNGGRRCALAHRPPVPDWRADPGQGGRAFAGSGGVAPMREAGRFPLPPAGRDGDTLSLWGRVRAERGGEGRTLSGEGSLRKGEGAAPLTSALHADPPHPQPLPARGREWGRIFPAALRDADHPDAGEQPPVRSPPSSPSITARSRSSRRTSCRTPMARPPW